jgi:hypothetical protein
MAQLLLWQQDGDKLIVYLDANEDIYCKSIGKSLTDINRLAIKEVVGKFTHQLAVPTFFWGPIQSMVSGHHQKFLSLMPVSCPLAMELVITDSL